MNSITIAGRLTSDPELRTTSNGTNVTRFTVAVNKIVNGEKAADFFDCSAFGKTGDNIQRYFFKGSLIAITGEIHQDKFTDKQGNKREKWGVNVQRFSFLQGKENAQPGPAEPSEAADPEDDDFPF